MNHLTLAAAGGRKTESIVERCVAAPRGRRILVLTYTQANQKELSHRLARHAPRAASVEVCGWFAFLLRNWIRPYLPRLYSGRRLAGLNFDGDPGWYAKGELRFLDSDGRAYKRHVAHLASDVEAASGGAVLDRLSHIVHEIHIDEVQDLNGWDLELLAQLMAAPIDLYMVGDVRQALLETEVQEQKNSQYKGLAIKKWFDTQGSKGVLEIQHAATTWRSNAQIAAFADSVFPADWGFPPTTSCNTTVTGHDGVFAVDLEHVEAYVARFQPLCLRYSANSAKTLDLEFVTFGMAKGLSAERVLIAATEGIRKFLVRGTPQKEKPCCALYVAATRARASVAFAAKHAERLGLPVWTPSASS
jgi:DNA helicase-2/ATP-dependent DNA helicase PcrA